MENAQVTVIGKKWWQSKIVWFNVVSTAIAVLGVLAGMVTTEKAAVFTALQSIGNVILRVWFTDSPIGTFTVQATTSDSR